MRRALLPLFLSAFLIAPAVARANGEQGGTTEHQPSAHSVAVQQCKNERAQIGRLAFKQKYGTPHAFKNCVRANGGSSKTPDDNGDQNGDTKQHRKHHKDNQNGDHKGERKHHKGDGTSHSKGEGNGNNGDGNGHNNGDN